MQGLEAQVKAKAETQTLKTNKLPTPASAA